MEFLKEWNDVEKTSRKITRAFEKWAATNLIVTYGKDKTTELTFGLPYTSSSSWAGLWVCQGEGRLRADREWKFRGLLITTENEYVALFENSKLEQRFELLK